MRPPNLKMKSQSGVVIVVALFIIAIVAAMSYAMLARLSRDTTRTTYVLRNIEAQSLAEGSLMWALDELSTTIEGNAPKQLISSPLELAKSTINGFEVQSKIEDMQARFNLNYLKDPLQQEIFSRLLHEVDNNLKPEQLSDIVHATVDWISPEPDPKLEAYYLKLPEAYRPAHHIMTNPSELKLVKGMTPELYKALAPFICALPIDTKINVQTAPAEILLALHPDMNQNVVIAILGLRKQKPFKDVKSFLACEVLTEKARGALSKIADVQSSYFLVATNVSIDVQHLMLYSLVERTTKEDAKIKLLWQSKGIWQ